MGKFKKNRLRKYLLCRTPASPLSKAQGVYKAVKAFFDGVVKEFPVLTNMTKQQKDTMGNSLSFNEINPKTGGQQTNG